MTIPSVFRSCCSAAWLLLPGLLAIPAGARAQSGAPLPPPESQSAIADFGSEPPAQVTGPAPTPAGDYKAAKLLKQAPVEYPTLADLNREEGVVTIRFYIDETGHVTKTAVAKNGASVLLNQLNGDPHLLQWTFQPATFDGKPVPSTHDEEFEFKLDPAEQTKLALHRLALPIGTPDPPYPPAAAAEHLHGDCVITVEWTDKGLVKKISLLKSSGVPYLDATALRFAYQNWRIDPAAMARDKAFTKTIKFTAPR